MDNICHTLVGAAFGEAGLKSQTRFGNTTLMIAANLPDLDVLVFATDFPSVAFRRGWTHGVLAQALLPVALTAAMLGIDRAFPAREGERRVRAKGLLLLSYIGVLSHVALDLLNNYGVRLLMPFSNRWFYGDAVFIIDPWLWVTLAAGIWLTRRRGIALAARQGLTLAAVYVAAMCLNARVARNVVLDEWRAERGGVPVSLMAGPVAVTPFRRQVIVDAGIDYETGTLNLLSGELTFEAVIPKNDTDPRVARAREAPNIRAFLVWSRFPVWTIDETGDGTRVSVTDLRFAGRGAPFVQSVVVR
jgi:inner membrane protein